MAQDQTLARPATQALEPIRQYDLRGGGGTTLHAREWGREDGPAILFVHGWSQCDLCWGSQVGSDLAERYRMVTFDNRGHGRSDKPHDAGSYSDSRLWADDIAALIEHAGLQRPVLVAWSYGGLIATDYVRAHGASAIGGIDLVGAAVMLRPPTFEHIGPGFLENAPDACLPDLATNIRAIQRFLRACSARPLDDELFSTALCWNMLVPPDVRGALISRDIDADDVLERLSVPVLVTHGRKDAIILPSMAEHVLRVCDRAVPSWYDGVGHMPFVEDAARFNAELAAFVDGAQR